jgi:hypothetical protein
MHSWFFFWALKFGLLNLATAIKANYRFQDIAKQNPTSQFEKWGFKIQRMVTSIGLSVGYYSIFVISKWCLSLNIRFGNKGSNKIGQKKAL